jgi:hypothetical protein
MIITAIIVKEGWMIKEAAVVICHRGRLLLSFSQGHIYQGFVYLHLMQVVEELLQDLLSVEEAFRPDPSTGAMTDQEIIDSLRKVRSWMLE